MADRAAPGSRELEARGGPARRWSRDSAAAGGEVRSVVRLLGREMEAAALLPPEEVGGGGACCREGKW